MAPTKKDPSILDVRNVIPLRQISRQCGNNLPPAPTVAQDAETLSTTISMGGQRVEILLSLIMDRLRSQRAVARWRDEPEEERISTELAALETLDLAKQRKDVNGQIIWEPSELMMVHLKRAKKWINDGFEEDFEKRYSQRCQRILDALLLKILNNCGPFKSRGRQRTYEHEYLNDLWACYADVVSEVSKGLRKKEDGLIDLIKNKRGKAALVWTPKRRFVARNEAALTEYDRGLFDLLQEAGWMQRSFSEEKGWTWNPTPCGLASGLDRPHGDAMKLIWELTMEGSDES